MTNSAVAGPATSDRPSRRSLLGAGAIGAALALSGARPASAAAGADDALAAFAISIELAARDLYDAAIAAGADDAVWTAMREQHESYAQRLAGITGISAQLRDEATYSQFSDAFASDPAGAGFELENVAAATHTELLGSVSDIDIAAAMASFVAMESRHATVLAGLSGQGDDLDALFLNTATALSPEA